MSILRRLRNEGESAIRSHARTTGTRVTRMSEPTVNGKGEVIIHAKLADGRTVKTKTGEYGGHTGTQLDRG